MRKKLCTLLLLVMIFTCIPFVRSQAAETIKLNKTNIIVAKGKTVALKLSGTKKKPKWSSDKKSVATVSKNGKITAKKTGYATITAKLGKKKYTCKVRVMTSAAIERKLNKAYNWQCEDIWNNGFCDIYHYIESGTNSIGKKMSPTKTIASVRKALKQKNNWNNFVNRVQGSKYTKFKKCWKKLYKEMLKLEKCLDAGIPKPKSGYYFPHEKYSDYLWDLFSEAFF